MVLIGLCVSFPAAADARVKVTVEATVIHIAAEVETSVDRATAWAVLTDYDHWAEFVPGLTLSRVISRPGEPLRVEQRGAVPWLPNFPLVVVSEVQETPPKSIRFQRIVGNVRALQGDWHIVGRTPVRLDYRAIVEPGFPVPPQVTVEFFRQDTRLRLEGLAKEMARRAAGAGSPPPGQ